MANPKKDQADETTAPTHTVLQPKLAAPPVHDPEPVLDDPAPVAKFEPKPALVHVEKAAVAPAPAATPSAVPPAGKRPYKVWSHGTLQRNGTTHQPGAVLTMTPEEAAKIPCLEPVT